MYLLKLSALELVLPVPTKYDEIQRAATGSISYKSEVDRNLFKV